jgi:hypothetical protein
MFKIKRIVAGGLIVLGAVLASMFGNLFRGPGLGDGDGRGNGPPAVNDAPNGDEIPDPQPFEPEPPVETPAVPETPRVVDILIDDRDYLVREVVNGEIQYREIELSELIERVKQAPGNDEGIRVRISRTESSRASAENLLDRSLEQAGIAKTEVHRVDELVR